MGSELESGSAVAYAYDVANRLTTVTDWLNEQATCGYVPAGQLSSFTQFNGIEINYTYDAARRLTGMASGVAGFQFTLDGNGNRIGSNETQPLSASARNIASTVYTYNAQKDRLLAAGPLSYAYDNEGQLVSSGGTCLTFDYNPARRGAGGDRKRDTVFVRRARQPADGDQSGSCHPVHL
jgi:YD repeat-containing protein